MPDDRRKRTPTEDPPEYRVYRAGDDRPRKSPRPEAMSAAGQERQRAGSPAGDETRPDPGLGSRSQRDRPYKLYSSRPRGLRALLRGEEDAALLAPRSPSRRGRDDLPRERRPWRWRRLTWRRGLAYVGIALVAWVFISFVLFMVSAETRAGDLPKGAESQLTSGGPMLTSANTVLVLGLDNRPTTGAGSKEPGSNYSETDANTDTIMLWRIGGGVSRRLSIPRDTAVNIPGLGESKINAAWAFGGPALALKVIKQFTGLQINHLIVIDLGNFPKFIDDIGGVTVRTSKICSNISGGTARGGFTLNLSAGVHHLNGEQAMVLARTRENSCNVAYTDLNREAAQQQIMNGIKSQLLSFHAFVHLPWAAWDAPGVIQTDMGGLTLMQLFIASEIGGSAAPQVLKPSGSETLADGGSALVMSPSTVSADVRKLVNG
jgi:LCP family protein required for cell wall assembly